jgi:hypothetical protein
MPSTYIEFFLHVLYYVLQDLKLHFWKKKTKKTKKTKKNVCFFHVEYHSPLAPLNGFFPNEFLQFF